MKLNIILYTTGIFVLFGYNLHAQKKSNTIEFEINPTEKHQIIDNFSASDAWRIAFVGSYWPIEKRNQIADLLFSTKFDNNGHPIGIGLSNWRVNIGAGSYENRENNEVTSSWNRTECFLSPFGEYDFSKQAGQQWFMKAAKDRGVNNFLFFTNSAPYFMTRSGSTIPHNKNGINIRKDKFDDFAEFLVITTKHFIDKGFNVKYISPINEPQNDWSQNKWQEGSFSTSEDAYNVVKELDKAISKYNIDSKIVYGEAGMRYMFDYDTVDHSKPDNVIEEFFTKKGKYNIMNLKNLYNCVSAHDYWTAYPPEYLVSLRKRVADTLMREKNGTKFWASEYCILEKNDDLSGKSPEEKSINLGLYTARIIHADLAIANASAWQWWTAVSLGEDVPIQLKPMPECNAESVKYDGIVSPTKMLWTTGNYSLFIRPGMWRIGLKSNPIISDLEAVTSLMGSAYTDGEKIVLVFINYKDSSKTIKLKGVNSKKGKVYITDINRDLEYSGNQSISKLIIPKKSVTTIIIK